MLMAILLALATALGWGASDYFGGDASRGASPLAVVAVAELLGLAPLALIQLATGAPFPAEPRLLFAVAAGMSVTLELSIIYTAISKGLAFITAPVGALGALGAVAVGLVGGESLGALAAVGIAFALLGSGISAWAAPGQNGTGHATSWRAAQLCLVAAAAVATSLSTLHAAGRLDPVWATAVEHASTTLSAGLAVLVASRRSGHSVHGSLPRGVNLKLLLVAVAGTGGDLAYVAASRHGALGIVSTISSLYPVTTIALGATFLRQRPTRAQAIGIVLALAGAVLLGANPAPRR
jgi:drug/metabolite transporter (DMT)-like permease